MSLVVTSWRELAACRGSDLRIWFPEAIRPKELRARLTAEATELCAVCPVAADCLDDALAEDRADDQHGIRAGLTPEQRDRLRHRMTA